LGVKIQQTLIVIRFKAQSKVCSQNVGHTFNDLMSNLKMFKITGNPKELAISEIVDKYPKRWVTINISKRDVYGLPVKGEVVIEAKQIDEIEEKINHIQGDLYIFYTGSIDDDLD